jgi:hypothetical protein
LFTALGGAYPGLRLIKKQTVGSAVASVQVTSAFSATYENYKIIYTNGVGSGPIVLTMTLGSTSTGYSNCLIYGAYSTGVLTGAGTNNGSFWNHIGYATTNSATIEADVLMPFLTKNTYFNCNHMQNASAVYGTNGGVLNDSTSYSSFTISTASGTLTGGTIYVYGYGIS